MTTITFRKEDVPTENAQDSLGDRCVGSRANREAFQVPKALLRMKEDEYIYLETYLIRFLEWIDRESDGYSESLLRRANADLRDRLKELEAVRLKQYCEDSVMTNPSRFL